MAIKRKYPTKRKPKGKKDIPYKIPKPPKKLDKIIKYLNEKQKEFCKLYVIDYNGLKSYQTVYKVNSKIAQPSSSRLLSNVIIQEYIKKLRENREQTSGISFFWSVNELKKIVNCSASKVLDNWITRKEFEKLPDEIKDGITEISTKILKKNIGTHDNPEIIDVEYVNLKFPNKLAAIEQINKMFGFFAPLKNEHTGKDGKDLLPEKQITEVEFLIREIKD